MFSDKNCYNGYAKNRHTNTIIRAEEWIVNESEFDNIFTIYYNETK